MKRVEIWTTREEHIVFNDVLSYCFTDKERFFSVTRYDKTDYIPIYDIRRITVSRMKKR